MSGRRRITVKERRARVARRHHLASVARARSVVEVANDLVALHSTDPASVFLAAYARMRTPEVGAIEQALYKDRTLVRMLGMRRTMFVVPLELAPIIQSSCTRTIALQQRRLLVQLLEEGGVTKDAARWLKQVEQSLVRTLAARGEATGAELSRAEPRLQNQLLLAEGKNYEAVVNVTTRVLFLMAAEGRIIRGRPLGSWISSQYRWSLTESWLKAGMVERPTETARVELARRWLTSFGPGIAADLRWWTGWTMGEARRSLEEVGAVEVDLDGEIGLVLGDDLEPVAPVGPWVAFLPALDPTVMAWLRREWFLGTHAAALFDRSGNAGPTVWWDGRIVGGWAQRKNGEVVFRLLEDVGKDALTEVEAAAERLRAWLADIRVTPRFRTPLERELSA